MQQGFSNPLANTSWQRGLHMVETPLNTLACKTGVKREDWESLGFGRRAGKLGAAAAVSLTLISLSQWFVVCQVSSNGSRGGGTGTSSFGFV